MKCSICHEDIGTRKATVNVVGGLFPEEDPDFFMIDETIMKELYAHLDCFQRLVATNRPVSESGDRS